MRVNQNLMALNAHRNFSQVNSALSKSLERLSSGLRINRAADDAAGLAISEKMRAQIRGLTQASRNAQDGISLIQTAEGALSEIHSMLQRMRELAAQAATDTLTANDRVQIQSEIDQLKAEINRVARTTEFNKQKLLDGTAAALVSTDRATTQVFARGSIRGAAGNYQLEVTATPGQGQIQQTDIFKIRETTATVTSNVNTYSGLTALAQSNLLQGNYTLEVTDVTVASAYNDIGARASLVSTYQQSTANGSGLVRSAGTVTGNYSASILFEVTARSGNQLTVNIYSHQYDKDGNYTSVLSLGQNLTAGASNNLTVGGITLTGLTLDDADHFTAGDKWVISVVGDPSALNENVLVLRRTDTAQAYRWLFSNNVLDNTSKTIKLYQLNTSTGEAIDASITTTFGTLAEAPAIQNLVVGSNVGTVSGDELAPNRSYSLAVEADAGASAATATRIAVYSQAGVTNLVSGGTATGTLFNADILFEVVGIDGNSIYLRAISHQVARNDGAYSRQYATLTATAGTAAPNDFTIGSVTISNIAFTAAANFRVGDRFVYHVRASAAATTDQVLLTVNGSGARDWRINNTGATTYNFAHWVLDTTTGQVWDTNLEVQFTAALTDSDDITFTTGSAAGTLTRSAGGVAGETARLDTQLNNIDRFYDANGRFLLDNPQAITITQGDGTSTTVYLYGYDTLQQVRDKLAAAIRDALGQGDVAGASTALDRWVQYVSVAASGTPESVAGTMVIRSAIAGSNGKLYFIGDEDLINALSLVTVREARENVYRVNVTNKMTGETVASAVTLTNNLLQGVIHSNIDVRFDPSTGIEVGYDATNRAFTWTPTTANNTTTVHIADSSLVFQVGANEAQTMDAAVGRMDAAALGVDAIIVTDREAASRAITTIDQALERVSSERSRLGAIQNRLEHTIANLGVAAENTTAAESRIRDVDMAQEMIQFTRLQVLNQAGIAMLAQANTIPSYVLQLLR